MTTRTVTLNIPIGDARDYRITAKRKSDGLAFPFTETDKIVLSVKRNLSDSVPLFQRKSAAAGGGDAEIKIVDGPGGIIDVFLVEANTLLLTPPGSYSVDVVAELAADGKERTILEATIVSRLRTGPAIT